MERTPTKTDHINRIRAELPIDEGFRATCRHAGSVHAINLRDLFFQSVGVANRDVARYASLHAFAVVKLELQQQLGDK